MFCEETMQSSSVQALSLAAGEVAMSEANSVAPGHIPESFQRYLKQHMTEDHEKLEGMLDDAACLVAHRSFYTAGKRFEDFQIRTEQHMAVEENIVFPLLETVSPNSPAIAEVKGEHEIIRQAMETAAGAIAGTDRERFGRIHGELAAALTAHTRHEDELVTSALESCVGAKRELLLKIARL